MQPHTIRFMVELVEIQTVFFHFHRDHEKWFSIRSAPITGNFRCLIKVGSMSDGGERMSGKHCAGTRTVVGRQQGCADAGVATPRIPIKARCPISQLSNTPTFNYCEQPLVNLMCNVCLSIGRDCDKVIKFFITLAQDTSSFLGSVILIKKF